MSFPPISGGSGETTLASTDPAADLPTAADWVIGQQLTSDLSRQWQYKITDVKRGGFGSVYIVSDNEGYPLALKTLQGRFTWSDEERNRFEREIVTWLRLGRHPRVVHAICLDRVEGRPALIMEFLPGGSVGDQIEKGPLSMDTALHYGLDVCAGMDYAHRKLGIIHRDLKPSNCLLTPAGRLKITDFGLAKMLSELKTSALGLPDGMLGISPLTSTPLGTPSYMPPEQWVRGAELDARTDIYSFGVMFYEMLTAELPSFGPAAEELVRESEASKALPTNLRDLILRCVAKDRDRRPATFECLRRELEGEYKRLFGKEPPSAEAVPEPKIAELNAMGMTLQQLGHLREAIQFFDQGLEISPADRYLLVNKGTALRKQNDFKGALECYEAALEVAPDEIAIWGNLAQLFVQRKDFASALRAFDKALLLTPDDPILIGNKAVTLFRLHRISEALVLSEEALAKNPRNARLHTARADMWLSVGNLDEAARCLDRAISLDPINHEAWEAKATVLHQRGDYHDALLCIKRSLGLKPNQPDLEMLKEEIEKQFA